MAMHFCFCEDDVKVTLRATSKFHLIFDDAQVCDTVLRAQVTLQLGWVSFLLAPWTRSRRASPAKMVYKVRVCLEGVLEHS